MARPRDSQYSRVLAAETTIRGETTTIGALQMRGMQVYRSAWFRKRKPALKSISVVVERSTTCNEVILVNPVIQLGKTHATELDLMHAIAHLLHPTTTALHGPEFTRQYLDITRRFLGQDVYKSLDEAFRAEGVKSRVWSKEAKDAAKARYAEHDLKQLLNELKS